MTWRKCDFWSSDPNRSLGLNLVHFSNLKEKWTTTLQKFFTLLQPTGGCKIFISIKANLIKKCISFNGSYAKILCIPSNSKCVLHREPEYLFPNQIILGSLRKKMRRRWWTGDATITNCEMNTKIWFKKFFFNRTIFKKFFI